MMPSNRWATVAVLVLAAAPAGAQSLPAGVYDCYGRGMAEGGQVRDTAGQLNLGGSKFSVIGAASTSAGAAPPVTSASTGRR